MPTPSKTHSKWSGYPSACMSDIVTTPGVSDFQALLGRLSQEHNREIGVLLNRISQLQGQAGKGGGQYTVDLDRAPYAQSWQADLPTQPFPTSQAPDQSTTADCAKDGKEAPPSTLVKFEVRSDGNVAPITVEEVEENVYDEDSDFSELDAVSGNAPESSETATEMITGSTPVVHPSHVVKKSTSHDSTGHVPSKAAIKAKIIARRTHVTSTARVEKEMYKDTPLGKFMSSGKFELISCSAIALNGFWMPFDLDLNKAETLRQTHFVFILMNNLFCIFFLLEWILRYVCFKDKYRFFYYDKWHILDTVLIPSMVFDTWVMSAVELSMPQSGESTERLNALPEPQVLRVLRLVRLLRMGRVAKMLRAAPELLYLVDGVLAGARSVGYAMVLLFFALFLFSLFFVQWSRGTQYGKEYFPHVPESMLTLLQFAVLLDGPTAIIQAIRDESWAATIVFFICILATALTLMNMIIGVLCEVVSTVSAAHREADDEARVYEVLSEVFARMDTDDDKLLDRNEFLHGIHEHENLDALHDLDVDTRVLVQSTRFLFQSDVHGVEFKKKISFDKFARFVESLRGDAAVKVSHLIEFRKWMHKQLTIQNGLQKETFKLQRAFARSLSDATNLSNGSPERSSPVSRRSGDSSNNSKMIRTWS